MRQSIIPQNASHRMPREAKPTNVPPYTRTEIDNRLAALMHELQYGNTRPREEVRKELDEVLELWANAPWYTMEEINASLDKFRREVEAGEGIPHEQAMKEIDEFMKCL
ncbi:MAG: hypothetical protein IJ467_08075 [Bacteroidaceae bacterium]|nr:hypothetical protein [Bacteroidaceae bacterium]